MGKTNFIMRIDNLSDSRGTMFFGGNLLWEKQVLTSVFHNNKKKKQNEIFGLSRC